MENTSDNSSKDDTLEQYKVAAAWSMHLLRGIQTRIESQQPELNHELLNTDHAD